MIFDFFSLIFETLRTSIASFKAEITCILIHTVNSAAVTSLIAEKVTHCSYSLWLRRSIT